MTFESLRQDIQYAIRGLRLKPGFTIAVVATLGLGIGANAAMFGIVDRLLFRPPELMRNPGTAHRIYLFSTFRGKERASTGGQYARYKDIEKWTTSFSDVAGYSSRDMAIGTGDAAREMRVGVVSSNFFKFFDAPPVLGRYFTRVEDSLPNGAPVAVVSYPMWQTQYGGRNDVVGSKIQIGSLIYTVIGVSPRGFVGLWSDKPPAAFVPISTFGAEQGATLKFANAGWWKTYSWGWMSVIVRRKAGVSVAAANADLTQAFLKSYQAQLVEQPKSTPIALAKLHASVGSILTERGPNESSVAKVATWVGGVSVIVLLIACANVANLLLARALRRRREVALRIALGVSRGRLLSQLLTESIILALLGGVAGIVIAHWGGAALRAGLLDKSEAAAGFRDPRTLFFAFGAALVVGLLTGLAPILQATRTNLTNDLKSGSREGTYHRSPARVVLLVLQGALSVILLVGAGLFVRSLRNVQSVRLGYDVDPVLMVNLNMRGVKLDSAATVGLRERLLAAAKALPGVQTASAQLTVPFWSQWSMGLFVQGIDTVGRLGQFDLNAVSPEYFSAMGTRILRGRGISDADQVNTPKVAIVSEAMGRVLWQGKDPIGQCMKIGSDTVPCTTVVGVAENIKEQSLSADSSFFYYVSWRQFNPLVGGVFVRTRGSAAAMKEGLRRRLQHEMPGASYVTITPLNEIIGSQTRSWQLGATMFVTFGVLALVLAAIGLYSVIAYNVAQRTHEMGVRVALGAQMRDVVSLVLTDGLRLSVTGLAIGMVIALWATKWVKPLLFDESPRDPYVFVIVGGTLLGVAILASLIPARRAAKVEPTVALRSD
jgi:putative ABC transport system permease protein